MVVVKLFDKGKGCISKDKGDFLRWGSNFLRFSSVILRYWWGFFKILIGVFFLDNGDFLKIKVKILSINFRATLFSDLGGG